MAKKDLQKSQASRLWKSKLPTDQVAQCGPFLSKGLRVLCVLNLALLSFAVLFSVMTTLANIPDTDLIESTAGSVIWAVYGAVLLVLSRQIPDYRLSGICTLAYSVGRAFSNILLPSEQASIYFEFLATLLPFILYIGRYSEYKAHAAVLHDVDQRLARRWQRLWTWEIVYLVSAAVATFALLIVPRAAFAFVAAAVLIDLVISGARAVYLYQTANALLAFSQRYKAN